MYTYLLVAVVVLFALYKYDVKQLLDVQVTDDVKQKIKLAKLNRLANQKGGGKGNKSDIDYSKYVLKSSIPPCAANGADALQFSGDANFKSIESCYSKHKPQGGALKMKDFIKCIYPEFNDSQPAKVPTSTTPPATQKKNGEDEDSFDLGESFDEIKDFVKDNLIYVVIGVSIIIAAIIISGSSGSSGSTRSTVTPAY